MRREDYLNKLQHLFEDALEICKRHGQTVKVNKVCAKAAVEELRDALKNSFGSVPLEALLAMQEFLKRYEDC